MATTDSPALLSVLESALVARLNLLDHTHQAAIRLFNGFYEGFPELVIELYADTLLVTNHANPPQLLSTFLPQIYAFYAHHLPWLRAIVLKTRHAQRSGERNGALVSGDKAAQWIREDSTRYAVDLCLNQDASFYLDTRLLRAWLVQNMSGKSVLNTFAYTGSLGVAARAGGASQVIYLDLNPRFLNLVKESYTLNNFSIHKRDFLVGDFFPLTSRMRRERLTFDCVILDPPFYSTTPGGNIDLLNNYAALVKKVKPLVADQGFLITINNALFLNGEAYHSLLEELCSDGFMSIETTIPVPPDCTGYPQTISRLPPVDPAPFNHPTKIAILRVQRKDAKALR